MAKKSVKSALKILVGILLLVGVAFLIKHLMVREGFEQECEKSCRDDYQLGKQQDNACEAKLKELWRNHNTEMQSSENTKEYVERIYDKDRWCNEYAYFNGYHNYDKDNVCNFWQTIHSDRFEQGINVCKKYCNTCATTKAPSEEFVFDIEQLPTYTNSETILPTTKAPTTTAPTTTAPISINIANYDDYTWRGDICANVIKDSNGTTIGCADKQIACEKQNSNWSYVQGKGQRAADPTATSDCCLKSGVCTSTKSRRKANKLCCNGSSTRSGSCGRKRGKKKLKCL